MRWLWVWRLPGFRVYHVPVVRRIGKPMSYTIRICAEVDGREDLYVLGEAEIDGPVSEWLTETHEILRTVAYEIRDQLNRAIEMLNDEEKTE